MGNGEKRFGQIQRLPTRPGGFGGRPLTSPTRIFGRPKTVSKEVSKAQEVQQQLEEQKQAAKTPEQLEAERLQRIAQEKEKLSEYQSSLGKEMDELIAKQRQQGFDLGSTDKARLEFIQGQMRFTPEGLKAIEQGASFEQVKSQMESGGASVMERREVFRMEAEKAGMTTTEFQKTITGTRTKSEIEVEIARGKFNRGEISQEEFEQIAFERTGELPLIAGISSVKEQVFLPGIMSREVVTEIGEIVSERPSTIPKEGVSGKVPISFDKYQDLVYLAERGDEQAKKLLEKVTPVRSLGGVINTQQIIEQNPQLAEELGFIQRKEPSETRILGLRTFADLSQSDFGFTFNQITKLPQIGLTPTGEIKLLKEIGEIILTRPDLSLVTGSDPEPIRGGIEAAKFIIIKPFIAAKGALKDFFAGVRDKEFSKETEKILGEDLLADSGLGIKGLNLFSRPGRKTVGLVGGAATSLIGETPLEVGLDIAGASLFTKIPKLARFGISSVFIPLGTSQAMDEELTTEERIAGGFIAGLGAYGALSEALPLFRGFFARKSTKTITGATLFEGQIDESLKLTDDILRKQRVLDTELIIRKDPDILLIPPGGQKKFAGERAVPKLKGDVDEIVKVYSRDIPLRSDPELPKTRGLKAEIIDALKGREEVLSGSFAEVALVKGKTTKLDPQGFFKSDLDILSKNLPSTRKLLKSKFGKRISIIEKTITDSPFGEFKILKIKEVKTGEVIGDIDPFRFAEEGFAQTGRTFNVEGVRLLDPQVRLKAKLTQLTRGKVGQQKKVVSDISRITGEELEIGAEVLGGFGFTFEEQVAQAGKKSRIGISAIDFFKKLVGDEVRLNKELFGTPGKIDEPFLIRESRLLLDDLLKAPSKEARISFSLEDATKSRQALLLEETISTGKFSPEKVRRLASQAQAGDISAERELLAISRELRAEKGTFTISVQRRGELETRLSVEDVIIRKKGEQKPIRVKGRAVEVIEAEIKKLSPGEGDKGFSKETQRLLTESRKKGFRDLPEIKQEKIIQRLSKETGFNIDSIINEKVFISPAGISAFALGTTTLSRRLSISPQGIPLPLTRFDLTKESRRGLSPREERRPTITRRKPSIPETRRGEDPTMRLPPTIRRDIRPTSPPTIRPPRRPPTTPTVPPDTPPEVGFLFRKQKITKKKEKEQAFNVFVKPAKLKGKKQQPGKKVNLVPLKKKQAEKLRDFTLDTSLGRTGEIRRVKGKPQKPLIPIRSVSPSKFRDFRQVKGKRKQLKEGKVIEKGKFLLDTPQERKKITVAKRIQELRGMAKKKSPISSKKPKQLNTRGSLQSMALRL